MTVCSLHIRCIDQLKPQTKAEIHPEAIEWQVFFLLTLIVRISQLSLSAGSFQSVKTEFLRISGIRVCGCATCRDGCPQPQ